MIIFSSVKSPGASFSKALGTFRARKAIFGSSVSKNAEVYTPEISYMKGTSVHIKNTLIKQLCSHKVRDFVMAFRVRKLFRTFEKRAPVSILKFYDGPRLKGLRVREKKLFIHPSTSRVV